MFNPSPMQQPAQRPMPPQAPPQQPPVTGSNFTMNQVPDLTAKLSMLPAGSLQQFAQLHKGDPYVMALVMSESNRRKALQQAGQQPQGEAPKVVDQMISSLALPEDRGIAQLPTPNMANMADGGIAGYSDDEEGYAAGGVPGYGTGGVPEGALIIGNSYQDPETGIMKPLPEAESLPFGNVQQRPKDPGLRSVWDKYMETFMTKGRITERDKKRLREMDKNYQNSPEAAATPQTQQGTMPGPNYTRTDPRFSTEGKPLTPVSAPLGERQAAAAAAAGPRMPGGAGAGITALDTDPAKLAAQQAALQKTPTNPFAGQIDDIVAARQAVGQNQLKQLDEDIAKAGPAFADREARLKAKEGRIEKQGTDLGGMSLLEAGLAIMGGTSQNALANIGAGAQVGLKSYKAGLDKLEESRDKLDEAYGRIEEFRRNEDSMNNKERRTVKRDIDQSLVEGKQLGLAALQEDWKMNRQDANKAFEVLSNNRAKMYEQGQENYRTGVREAGANARANMPGQQERLFATLGGGDVKKGFNIFTEANAEGRGDQVILAAYAKDPNALATLKDTDPILYKAISERLRAQMIPTPPLVGGKPAAGQVRAP